jgi:hypothetical protein
MIRSLTLAALCCVATARLAVAGEQLDQSYAPASGPIGEFYGTTYYPAMAQTFTVGLSGYLSRIDLGVAQTNDFEVADLTIEISRTTDGVPDINEQLAARVIPAEQVPVVDGTAFLKPLFDVSADFLDDRIAVAPGDVLAIWVKSQTNNSPGYGWRTTYDGETYPGGTSYAYKYRGDLINLGDNNFQDFEFRTFISTPEPSSFMLTSVALAVFGISRRRSSGKSVTTQNDGANPANKSLTTSQCGNLSLWCSVTASAYRLSHSVGLIALPTRPVPAPRLPASWRSAECGGRNGWTSLSMATP